jgi:hypothetical protein
MSEPMAINTEMAKRTGPLVVALFVIRVVILAISLKPLKKSMIVYELPEDTLSGPGCQFACNGPGIR